MCVGFALLKGLNHVSVCVYFGEPASTLLMCFCLLLLVSLRLAFSSCVTALFLLGLHAANATDATSLECLS